MRGVGGETSCLTPGFRLSRANGQSIPSVDSISIVGAGGKVFSSALRERKKGVKSDKKKNIQREKLAVEKSLQISCRKLNRKSIN